MEKAPFAQKIGDILKTPLPKASEVLAEGREIAAGIEIGRTAFFEKMDVSSETEYKRRCIAEGRVMYHCHIGMSTWEDTARSLREIYKVSQRCGFVQDRAGLCLDRRMGLPSNHRGNVPAETGPMLDSLEQWLDVGRAAPIQPHMGDFMIGFPASTENTVNALRAGVTTIGNLSQFFAHEVPLWRDHLGTTLETARAVAVLGALREKGTLFHSYLDDGFGALFVDSATVAGWAMLERYIVEDLFGAKLAHCMGGLITDPVKRSGWIFALDAIHEHDCIGSMFFGDTLSFTADFATSRGVVSEYMLWDIMTQLTCPTGHGLLSIPVTEAIRVPSVDEIIDAQIFARRIEKSARRMLPLFDLSPARKFAERVVANGKKVFDAALAGLKEAGVDIADPLQMLFVLKVLGPSAFEAAFGAGSPDEAYAHGRKPVIPNDVFENSEALVAQHLVLFALDSSRKVLRGKKILLASTDVHEHALFVLNRLLGAAGAEVVNMGPECNPDEIAERAAILRPNALLVSTHNGMALEYAHRLLGEMTERNLDTAVVFGGVLNQKVDGEEMPVDVSDELRKLNIEVAGGIEEIVALAGDLWG